MRDTPAVLVEAKKDLTASQWSYWPWSAFWHVCADFIRDAYEWLYRKLSTMFVHLTEKRLAGLVPPEPEAETETRTSRGRRPGDAVPTRQGGLDHPAG